MIFRPAMCLVAAVMLLIAIVPMQQSYYAALRVVVALVALMEIILTPQSSLPESRKVIWLLAFFAMALGFNPFVPLQITRELWIALDVMGIIIFGWAAITHRLTPKPEEPGAHLEWRSTTPRKGLLYDPEIHGNREHPQPTSDSTPK